MPRKRKDPKEVAKTRRAAANKRWQRYNARLADNLPVSIMEPEPKQNEKPLSERLRAMREQGS
jgi:hypothetical protein